MTNLRLPQSIQARPRPNEICEALTLLSALNAATANDTLSVSLWIQLSAISQSSAFWFHASSQDRAFQAHTPWSDDVVYFDTSGCCNGGSQRISASIKTFPGYTNNPA